MKIKKIYFWQWLFATSGKIATSLLILRVKIVINVRVWITFGASLRVRVLVWV